MCFFKSHLFHRNLSSQEIHSKFFAQLGHTKEVARSRRRLGTTSAEKLLGKEQLLTWEGGNHDHSLSNGKREMGAYLKSWPWVCCTLSNQFSQAMDILKSNFQNYQLELGSSWSSDFFNIPWNVHHFISGSGDSGMYALWGMLEFLADLGRLTEVRDPAQHEVAKLREFCAAYGIPWTIGRVRGQESRIQVSVILKREEFYLTPYSIVAAIGARNCIRMRWLRWQQMATGPKLSEIKLLTSMMMVNCQMLDILFCTQKIQQIYTYIIILNHKKYVCVDLGICIYEYIYNLCKDDPILIENLNMFEFWTLDHDHFSTWSQKGSQ